MERGESGKPRMNEPLDPTRYVIVGMARSGTTAVHRALYGHPNVCAIDDEIRVQPFFSLGVATFTVGGKNDWERRRSALPLFDAITRYRPESPNPEGRLVGYCGTPDFPKREIRAHGLKVAIPTAEDATLLVDSLQLDFPGVRVVHVRRSDWVAQCASLERAMKSGVWHSFAEKREATGSVERMTIPELRFRKYVQMALEVEAQLARLKSSHDVFDFSYEQDLQGGRAGVWPEIFRFLGVPEIGPTWMRSSKVAPPIDSFLENAAELHGILSELRP